MKKLINNILFGLVSASYKRAKAVLLGALVLLAFSFFPMGNISLDVSNESYLDPSDLVRVNHHKYQKMFGSEVVAIIELNSKDGGIFSREKLSYIDKLHSQLASIEGVISVDSLINGRVIHSFEDEILIEDLAEAFSAQMKVGDYLEIENYVRGNPSYLNSLVDSSGLVTTMNVKLRAYQDDGNTPLSDMDHAAIVKNILAVLNSSPQNLFDIRLSGSPIVTYRVSESVQQQLGLFTGLSLLIVIIVLAVLFKRVSGVLMPLLVIVYSIFMAFASMGVFSIPASAMTQVLPSLIVAFGICDAIHLLSIFFKLYDQNGSKLESLQLAIEKCGFPLVMTTLTTAGGLASFAFSEMPPVRGFGILGAIAIVIALVVTLVLIPTMIALFPLVQRYDHLKEQEPILSRVALILTEFGISKPKLTAISSLVVLGVLVSQLGKLEFSHDPIKWYERSHLIRYDVEKIDADLKGHLGINLIFDSGRDNGINDPEFMSRIDWIDGFVADFDYDEIRSGSTQSLLEMIREMNSVLNSGDYSIPKTEALIAQEILLIEMGSAEDLHLFTDSSKRYLRLIVRVPLTDLLKSYFYVEALASKINSKYGDLLAFEVTGTSVLVGKAFSSLLKVMSESYIYAFIIISLLILINTRSLRIGGCIIFANLLPIIFGLSILVWMDMPLNIFTMLVGSIMLGVVVDDSIHFIEHYLSILKDESLTIDDVLRETTASVGGSLIYTSLVLGLSFLVYTASDIKNILVFGVLCFLTCIVALISDLMLLPALLKWEEPSSRRISIYSKEGFENVNS